MRRLNARRATLAATAVALLTLAACGDDDKTATPTTPAAAAPTSEDGGAQDTVADTLMEGTVVDDTVVDSGPAPVPTLDDSQPAFPDEIVPGAGIGTEFCDVNTELNETESPLDAEQPDPVELEAYFSGAFPEMFGRFAAAAPADMQDEVEVLAEGLGVFADLLEANGWSIEAAYSDPAFETLMFDERFNEAGIRVDTYCGMES